MKKKNKVYKNRVDKSPANSHLPFAAVPTTPKTLSKEELLLIHKIDEVKTLLVEKLREQLSLNDKMCFIIELEKIGYISIEELDELRKQLNKRR